MSKLVAAITVQTLRLKKNNKFMYKLVTDILVQFKIISSNHAMLVLRFLQSMTLVINLSKMSLLLE